jgi:hypothetical protein
MSTDMSPQEEHQVYPRITTWIGPDAAVEVSRLRKHFGFKSNHQLFKASIFMAIRLLQDAEQREKDPDDTTIQDAFKTLADWEAPEFGRRRRRRKEGHKETAVLLALFNGQASSMSKMEIVGEQATPSHADAPKWYDCFIRQHYQALYDKYADRAERLTGDSLAPRDLLHESLLRLQCPPSQITSYESYERWALDKFNESRATHHKRADLAHHESHHTNPHHEGGGDTHHHDDACACHFYDRSRSTRHHLQDEDAQD